MGNCFWFFPGKKGRNYVLQDFELPDSDAIKTMKINLPYALEVPIDIKIIPANQPTSSPSVRMFCGEV